MRGTTQKCRRHWRLIFFLFPSLQVRPVGFEPTTAGLEIRQHSGTNTSAISSCDNADSVVATLVATKTPDIACKEPRPIHDYDRVLELYPADLARIVCAWPRLTEPMRQAVLAIVENASSAE